MQPISHDAYKRDNTPEPDANKAKSYGNNEQGDQWAILRHEVEEEDMQQRMEVGNNPSHQRGYASELSQLANDAHASTAPQSSKLQGALPQSDGTSGERVRSGWNQRDTEGETVSSSSSFEEFPLELDSINPQEAYNVDIVVAGVGGGGMNAINRMISTRVRGVRYIAMNTDAQVLALSQAPDRICLGEHHTKGLGAGGIAAVGMRAATESAAEIRAALGNADLVFIAAGMGGGTGTGAAPVIASIAKKLGALTIGIVTLPFTFEGTRRRRVAEQGLAELAAEIDALITVPNDRLLTTVARECNLSDAFKVADDVLRQGVQGIAEVINVPGMINVDFADVRSVLCEAGAALMSIGQGRGRSRAQQAAEEAIAGGFLNVTIHGAKRVLFNISGGEDMTLFEVNEVAERIGDAISSTADITFGAVIDPNLNDMLRVTLIAAGMEDLPVAQEEQTHAASVRIAPSATPRSQRSLNELRSLRNMERKEKDFPRGNAAQDDNDVDVPPFMKR